jgi:hypothetical protein
MLNLEEGRMRMMTGMLLAAVLAAAACGGTAYQAAPAASEPRMDAPRLDAPRRDAPDHDHATHAHGADPGADHGAHYGAHQDPRQGAAPENTAAERTRIPEPARPPRAGMAAGAPAPPAASPLIEAIERVRRATAAFHAIDEAVKAGYPAAVAQCVSHPQAGAMGFHHLNRGLLDGRIEPERPEILLYSREADGRYVLNGVEYVVPYSAHPPEAAPPTALGQPLTRSDGLSIWYLHVWIWKDNPSGMFADWNPLVSCDAGTAAAGGRLPRGLAAGHVRRDEVDDHGVSRTP